jgi:hypothetical protein
MTTKVESKMAIRIGKDPFRIYTLKEKSCLVVNNIVFLCSSLASTNNVIYLYP